MKTLYIDCSMGAAGDMLTAALLELVPDSDECIKKLNSLNIPGVKILKENTEKCGICATHIEVLVDGVSEHEGMHDHEHHDHHHDHEHDHHHDHHHSGMHEIEHIINDLDVSDKVKNDALSVYNLIAEAEGHVHGKPVTQIHFHEVGTMDAVADVVSACYLLNELAPDEVVVSPIHVGSGTVRCAHGVLPVPAPATAYILRDVPIYGGEIKGELCTPTGAAILKYYATGFGNMPVMNTKAIGYGAGTKDFEAANVVRAILGEKETSKNAGDMVIELACNIDDMTGEEIGYAIDTLFAEGARDAYTVPIGMKKSRPGTMICVMCDEAEREKFISLLFKHTTTIGIRENVYKRYVLDRTTETIRTKFGDVKQKVSEGYGVKRVKYENDDLVRIANETGMSLREIKEQLD